MTTTTLGDLTARHGFEVLEHLEAEAEVPVLKGLQAQGDLFIIPVKGAKPRTHAPKPIPAEGLAVIKAAGGGHEHRLFASVPGTAMFAFVNGPGQDIGVLECTEPVYSLHVEHGATGIAPGASLLRRQREQADEERLVAD
jgi:hypothetical protein